MTALALSAVGTLMPIVLAVTAHTQRRGLAPARLLAMAISAPQRRVRAGEREVRLLGMIEAPQRPTIWRVAALALPAERPFVHVIGAVAVHAPRCGRHEGQASVTLRAARQPMQSDEREPAQIVVEDDVGAPVVLTVTGVARLLELAAVRIFTAVTGIAGRAEFLRRGRCGVAGVTGDAAVGADEGEVVATQVIVGRAGLPVIVVVTVGALGAEASRMRVVRMMAAEAVLRQLLVVVAGAMAGQTIQPVVRTEQGKPGFLEVIESGALPLIGVVTLAAVRPT